MSETKHTKTPWIRDGLSIYALDELHGVYIKGKPVQSNRMYIRIEDHPNGLASKEETEANAALVFAAPDLLAALKDARDKIFWYRFHEAARIGLNYHDTIKENFFGVDPVLSGIDAAIAKAEGGE